jgi:hypothetical protein
MAEVTWSGEHLDSDHAVCGLEVAPVDEIRSLLVALGHDVRRREPARGGASSASENFTSADTSRGGRRRLVLVQRDGQVARAIVTCTMELCSLGRLDCRSLGRALTHRLPKPGNTSMRAQYRERREWTKREL